jgi:hypothetical protein
MTESIVGATAPASTTPAHSHAPSGGSILCSTVRDADRLKCLPRVFGPRHMIRAEATVYAWMAKLCPDYHGGYWEYVDLSNGGFYMRLVSDKPLLPMRSPDSCSAAEMTPDAASVTASLFALNALLWGGLDHLHEPYYLLRDFAIQHREARQILNVID